ncbi:hypothetical protein RI054_10g53030 [Pseudoscourfieldia marina]
MPVGPMTNTPSRLTGGRRNSHVTSVAPGSASFSVSSVITLGEESAEFLKMTRRVFEQFDSDNSGTLELDELKMAFAQMGMDVEEEEVDDLFQEMGKDKDGCLTCEEFTRMIVRAKEVAARESMAASLQAASIRTLLSDAPGKRDEDDIERALDMLNDCAPFFARLRHNIAADILYDTEVRTYTRGQWLCNQGTQNEGLFLVLDGHCAVFRRDDNASDYGMSEKQNILVTGTSAAANRARAAVEKKRQQAAETSQRMADERAAAVSDMRSTAGASRRESMNDAQQLKSARPSSPDPHARTSSILTGMPMHVGSMETPRDSGAVANSTAESRSSSPRGKLPHSGTSVVPPATGDSTSQQAAEPLRVTGSSFSAAMVYPSFKRKQEGTAGEADGARGFSGGTIKLKVPSAQQQASAPSLSTTSGDKTSGKGTATNAAAELSIAPIQGERIHPSGHSEKITAETAAKTTTADDTASLASIPASAPAPAATPREAPSTSAPSAAATSDAPNPQQPENQPDPSLRQTHRRVRASVEEQREAYLVGDVDLASLESVFNNVPGGDTTSSTPLATTPQRRKKFGKVASKLSSMSALVDLGELVSTVPPSFGRCLGLGKPGDSVGELALMAPKALAAASESDSGADHGGRAKKTARFLSAYFNNDKRDVGALAVGESLTVLFIPRETFRAALVRYPPFTFYQPWYCRTLIEKSPSQRSRTQIVQLSHFVSNMAIFNSLDLELRLRLARSMIYQRMDAASVVCLQGDVGDSMYIILDGSCSIHLMKNRLPDKKAVDKYLLTRYHEQNGMEPPEFADSPTPTINDDDDGSSEAPSPRMRSSNSSPGPEESDAKRKFRSASRAILAVSALRSSSRIGSDKSRPGSAVSGISTDSERPRTPALQRMVTINVPEGGESSPARPSSAASMTTAAEGSGTAKPGEMLQKFANRAHEVMRSAGVTSRLSKSARAAMRRRTSQIRTEQKQKEDIAHMLAQATSQANAASSTAVQDLDQTLSTNFNRHRQRDAEPKNILKISNVLRAMFRPVAYGKQGSTDGEDSDEAITTDEEDSDEEDNDSPEALLRGIDKDGGAGETSPKFRVKKGGEERMQQVRSLRQWKDANMPNSKLVGPCVKILRKSECFGELALLRSSSGGPSTRSATVVCRQETHFLKILKEDYDSTLRELQKGAIEEKIKFMRTTKLLSVVKKAELTSLLYFLRPIQAVRGTILQRQGGIHGGVFLIRSGEVRLTWRNAPEEDATTGQTTIMEGDSLWTGNDENRGALGQGTKISQNQKRAKIAKKESSENVGQKVKRAAESAVKKEVLKGRFKYVVAHAPIELKLERAAARVAPATPRDIEMIRHRRGTKSLSQPRRISFSEFDDETDSTPFHGKTPRALDVGDSKSLRLHLGDSPSRVRANAAGAAIARAESFGATPRRTAVAASAAAEAAVFETASVSQSLMGMRDSTAGLSSDYADASTTAKSHATSAHAGENYKPKNQEVAMLGIGGVFGIDVFHDLVDERGYFYERSRLFGGANKDAAGSADEMRSLVDRIPPSDKREIKASASRTASKGEEHLRTRKPVDMTVGELSLIIENAVKQRHKFGAVACAVTQLLWLPPADLAHLPAGSVAIASLMSRDRSMRVSDIAERYNKSAFFGGGKSKSADDSVGATKIEEAVAAPPPEPESEPQAQAHAKALLEAIVPSAPPPQRRRPRVPRLRLAADPQGAPNIAQPDATSRLEHEKGAETGDEDADQATANGESSEDQDAENGHKSRALISPIPSMRLSSDSAPSAVTHVEVRQISIHGIPASELNMASDGIARDANRALWTTSLWPEGSNEAMITPAADADAIGEEDMGGITRMARAYEDGMRITNTMIGWAALSHLRIEKGDEPPPRDRPRSPFDARRHASRTRQQPQTTARSSPRANYTQPCAYEPYFQHTMSSYGDATKVHDVSAVRRKLLMPFGMHRGGTYHGSEICARPPVLVRGSGGGKMLNHISDALTMTEQALQSARTSFMAGERGGGGGGGVSRRSRSGSMSARNFPSKASSSSSRVRGVPSSLRHPMAAANFLVVPSRNNAISRAIRKSSSLQHAQSAGGPSHASGHYISFQDQGTTSGSQTSRW